ncbi:TIR domain-containing protein [Butyrivibrio sp. XBB1001]|uniref:TIR domain-containing protein n=1 Tax=Butyrivibrio sp. XBB1001 TaxID=1280682 RepID=UPI00040EB2BB|nr:toll/interleukin-1 receptor domain-containing protein [Butyrivibrio sp. XBB1001]
MINHYNAFISYKHAELDNKIAEEIIKGLERFHIPQNIQESTGRRRIDRIFRDKDELPITNDLNDTISSALENSEYLIVICSTNTRKSTWVEKEIETFLKNHTKNQILTVLADGEPFEVIPQILLSDKKTLQDENGNSQTVEVPLEPLSCDYRLPIKKARSEELPRLVATLIGCSYDELMNRQRQYKIRRLSAIFAAAMALVIGFAGYTLYTSRLIHKNYIHSLENQSRYLSNESGKQLANENRIEAMQLALAALPQDENDDMPVTPEALKAITDSSYAYVAPSGTNVAAAWDYQMPGNINKFQLSSDETVLAAKDSSGVVMAWDTKTHKELLRTIKTDDETSNFFFFDPSTLIVARDHSFSVYDFADGSERWNYEYTNRSFADASYLKRSNESFIACNFKSEILEFNINDGSLLSDKYIFEEARDSISADKYCSSYALSDDGNRLALATSQYDDNRNTVYSLFEYDLLSEETIEKPLDQYLANHIQWINDNIYISCWDMSKGSLDSSTRMYNYTYVTEDHTQIYCCNSEDLSTIWENDFVCNNVMFNSGFLPMANGSVAYFSGNICEIWDSETGELIARDNTGDSIIDASDNDNDGIPCYVTKEGNIAMQKDGLSTSGIGIYERFSDDLSSAALTRSGAYTHQTLSPSITYYANKVYDEEFQLFENSPKFGYISDDCRYMDDSLLALIVNGDGDNSLLHLYDIDEKKYLGSVVLEGLSSYDCNILGKYDNNLFIVGNVKEDGDTLTKIFNINILTKDVKKRTPEQFKSLDSSFKLESFVMYGSKIVYYDSSEEIPGIGVIDVTDNQVAVTPISGLENKYFKNLNYFPELDTVYLQFKEIDVLVNASTGDIKTIHFPENWNGTTLSSYDPASDLFAFSDDHTIVLINSEGESVKEISCMNLVPLVMDFYNPQDSQALLIVAYKNGSLYRYSVETGEFIGKSDLSAYSNGSRTSNDKIVVDAENNLLFAYAGGFMDVFELDTWTEIAAIPSCLGYDVSTEAFIVYGYEDSSSETQVGYFKRYTVDELIDKTKGLLQGIEMTKEQKSMYGIG